jgi:oxygen-independent coproporphyrinogen-3 oxidase
VLGCPLYIHIPFCDGKCAYCAFYSVPYASSSVDTYLDALVRELAMQSRGPLRPETIYIGGGTPSLLGPAGFNRLVADLSRHVDFSHVTEWSMEVNPGNLSAGLLVAMRQAGVNRVSIGAQSFDDATLAAMGRRHRVADTFTAVDAVAAAGFDNWGLDLIAGYPGVSPAVWDKTLRKALALEPAHLSLYDFSLEPGTRMAQLAARGVATLTPEPATLAALQMAEDVAEEAGLRRYEVSNFARSGRECLHNLKVWRGEDYLGLGPAASSRVGLQRWTNRADLDGYVTALTRGVCPPRAAETLDPGTDLTERFMFAFRLTEGIDLGRFRDSFSPAPAQVAGWRTRLAGLVSEGLLVEAEGCWRPTPRGLRMADRVAEALL